MAEGFGAVERSERDAAEDFSRRDGGGDARHVPLPPGRSRRSSRWITFAVLVLAVAGGGWYASDWLKPNDQAPRAAAPPPSVAVSRPLLQSLDRRLGFLGQFSAVNRVELRAQVGGTLTEVAFKDGDIVQQGALLFGIDPRPYEIRLAEANADLQTATARLALATRQLYRAQELRRTEFGTAESVDQRSSEQRASQAAIDSANARIRDAQFDLEHCRIAAPFTGRISARQVSVGSLIAGSRAATSPTTLLTTLVSLDPIYLDFDMSEADFLALSAFRAQRGGPLGEPVQIAVGDGNGYKVRGSLDFVDNTLNRSSGTIHARATVPNPDLRLTPGQFARIRVLVAAPAPTLLVPDSAVQLDQSRRMVLTVSADGVVTPKPVETGDLRGGLRVIRAGLDPADQVITEGAVYVTPGAKVSIRPGTIASTADADLNSDGP